jgi:hypothetical protein
MAKRVVRGDDEEGLQKLFDSDNEVSDLSFGDSDSEEPQVVVQSESSDESDDNDECAPAPSKRVRTTTQTKQSEWDWKQIDNNHSPTIPAAASLDGLRINVVESLYTGA